MKISRNLNAVIRIAIACVCLAVGIIAEIYRNEYVGISLFAAGYLIVGYDVIVKAAKNIRHGVIFDENLLMIIASVGAFFIGEYPEALAVIALYQLGEVFQRYAVGKSRKSISSIMSLRPDCARLLVGGEEKEVCPEEVHKGDTIVVYAGDRVPLDGVVVSGRSALDCSALTGESLPVEVEPGSTVMSGTVNIGGVLELSVTDEYERSTVARVLELAENAADKKAKAENFITKFAAVYTPLVVISAVLVAVIPPLFTGEWSRWIYSALNFLVVSCPCAVVISVPMGFFCGIGATGEVGVLIKGSNYVEMLAKANVFAMDKTGTLTEGKFSVTAVYPADRTEEILTFASIAESKSSHPIARAITGRKQMPADGWNISEIAGKGMIAQKDNDAIIVGSAAFMADNGIEIAPYDGMGSVVYVARNREFIGSIVVSDTVKESAAPAMAEFRAMNARTVMLTGDNGNSAETVAKEVGISEVHYGLLPQDKLALIENMAENRKKGEVIAYLGDGINDAPSLIRADIGIAMGNIGSDSAVEAADAVLMRGDLTALCKAKKICRKTLLIVKENIVFALGVKALIMVLSVFGITNMWLAVFADVGVAALAILNSLRLSRAGFKKVEKRAQT